MQLLRAAGGSWTQQNIASVLTQHSVEPSCLQQLTDCLSWMSKSDNRYIVLHAVRRHCMPFSPGTHILWNSLLVWPCVHYCSEGVQTSTAELWNENVLDPLWSSGGVSNFDFSAGTAQPHLFGLATSRHPSSVCWTGATSSSSLKLFSHATALLFRAGAF